MIYIFILNLYIFKSLSYLQGLAIKEGTTHTKDLRGKKEHTKKRNSLKEESLMLKLG